MDEVDFNADLITVVPLFVPLLLLPFIGCAPRGTLLFCARAARDGWTDREREREIRNTALSLIFKIHNTRETRERIQNF